MAGVISAEMNADRLLLLTDVTGIKNSEGELVKRASSQDIKILLDSKPSHLLDKSLFNFLDLVRN